MYLLIQRINYYIIIYKIQISFYIKFEIFLINFDLSSQNPNTSKTYIQILKQISSMISNILSFYILALFIIVIITTHLNSQKQTLQMSLNNPYYQRQRQPQPSSNRVIQDPHFLNKYIESQNNLQNHYALNETEGDLTGDLIKNKQNLKKEINENYKPASYSKAKLYKCERSYYLKNSHQDYVSICLIMLQKELTLFEDTDSLKKFGLGAYFYIQYFRRIVWLFFVFVLLQVIRLYINIKNNGLSQYSVSFSTYLLQTTLGNIAFSTFLGNYNGQTIIQSTVDMYIQVVVPGVIMLVLFLFYIFWKIHYRSQIALQEENRQQILPEKYCIEIQIAMENRNFRMSEEILYKIFQQFGPLYEISLIERHKNKLQYFEQLEEIQEKIKEAQLQQKITKQNLTQKLSELRKDKNKLMKHIDTLKIKPFCIAAYVHFQYQKSKIACLTYFRNNYLYSSHLGDILVRNLCCCCQQTNEIKASGVINGQFKLYLKQDQVPSPEEINWQNYEITSFNRILRYLFGFLVILIFLALSCIIIGICSIYISSHSSNCSTITIPSSIAACTALNDETTKICYCESNLFASFSDSAIKSYCNTEISGLYIEQAIQYAIIAVSALTNVLFGFAVDKLINFTRPYSQTSGLLTKTYLYTIFLFFNTIFLPLLLYANIFGFEASNYLSFITIISADFKQILQFDKLQFYVDFDQIWYRNVSTIFINYVILDCLATWFIFIFTKCITANKENLKTEEGQILQKNMNAQITSYQLNVYKQYSSFNMIIFMCFIFHAGVPAIIPLGFLNLLTRYLTNRSLLQNESTRIEGLGRKFSSISLKTLPFTIIVGCLVGEWMLTGNTYIYPDGLSMSLNLDFASNFSILQRQLYIPYFLIIAIACTLEYILYNTVIRFSAWACSRQKIQLNSGLHGKPYSEHVKKMNILGSYNIRKNDKMRSAISRLDMYLDDQNIRK